MKHKMMNCAVLCAFALLAACPLPAAPQAAPADRGVFHIMLDGKEIGTERFEIASTADGVRATADLQMQPPGAGKTTETSTLVLRGGTDPLRYERTQKSPKRGSAILEFGPDKASAHYKTSEGGTQDMEYYVPKNVLILDTNFFHHYTFLVRQYDFVKGGPQHMDALIPQEASPGMVRVEFSGNDQGLRKLIAITDAMEISIWVNDANQIMKLAAPAAKVEVVRELK